MTNKAGPTRPSRLFNLRDASLYLRMSIPKLRGLIKRHELQVVRSSPRAKLLIDVIEIETYIQCHSTTRPLETGPEEVK